MAYKAEDVARDARGFIDLGAPPVLGVPTDETMREISIEPAPVSSVDYPFKISIHSATEIKIANGTVNNALPDEMAIGVDFVMEVTASAPVCLLCTFDAEGTLTATEFTLTHTEPTETTFCIQLGEVTVAAGVIMGVANYVTSSLGIMLCPDGEHADFWQIGGLA